LIPHSQLGARLVGIYGGKLTVYRATAEKVMRMLMKVLPSALPVADTDNLNLRA